jgi:hypothetical protein
MPTIIDSHVTWAGRVGTIPNYVSGIHCNMGMKGFFAICKGHRGDVYEQKSLPNTTIT